MLMFRSVYRIKLTTFTHQFAYNFQENDLELEIERELICAKVTCICTNPKIETQDFMGFVFIYNIRWLKIDENSPHMGSFNIFFIGS
ncbi:hypothetical protein Hanom_Chr17g01583791 [Helianthus anomalus]